MVPSGKKPSFGSSPWFSENASTPMSASSGLGFGSGTSVSLTPDAVPESIRYARMFLLLDRAQPCLIAHTDTRKKLRGRPNLKFDCRRDYIHINILYSLLLDLPEIAYISQRRSAASKIRSMGYAI